MSSRFRACTDPAADPPRARKALATLPGAEQDSIQTDVNTHQVRFKVTDKSQFDMEKVRAAFKDVGFAETTLIAGPG